MLSKKDATSMPKSGGSKGSGMMSPAHGGTSGIKKPGSKMKASDIRAGSSKR